MNAVITPPGGLKIPLRICGGVVVPPRTFFEANLWCIYDKTSAIQLSTASPKRLLSYNSFVPVPTNVSLGFPTPTKSYAKEIREGCVRGYAQSVKRWFMQAEKYAKTHGQVQLLKEPAEGEDGEGGGEEGEGKGKGGGEAGGKKEKGNKMSGRVVRFFC